MGTTCSEPEQYCMVNIFESSVDSKTTGKKFGLIMNDELAKLAVVSHKSIGQTLP